MNLPLETHWIRRARFLTQALMISGALNIGFLATFLYFVLKEKETGVSLELNPTESSFSKKLLPLTNNRLLQAYSILPFEELLLRLDQKEIVEDGYAKRDLALACLVAFHHFNLERALGGLILQQRQISFRGPSGEEESSLTVFPGLADYQYQAIIQYVKTEQWPFTSKGLFFELKRRERPWDTSLLQAFYLTPQFHSVSVLCSRISIPLRKETLVEMLVEGSWERLSEFFLLQRESLDLSVDRRRALLLSYLSCQSKIAAKILIESDLEFALKRLDDHQILSLLKLIEQQTEPVAQFLKQLITSPRSDEILKSSGLLLYKLFNEGAPDPYDHRITLARFSPTLSFPLIENKKSSAPIPRSEIQTKASQPSSIPPKGKAKRIHIVQQGENLWKIARKYHVSIEALMQYNRLNSEKLYPGKKIEIPDK